MKTDLIKDYPRLLVISNECLSMVSSNGRTLRNFLIGWPKENLAQFHIRNTAPDDTVCDNYFYVSDGDALKAFINGKSVNGVKTRDQNIINQATAPVKRKRNAVTMLIRELIWNSKRWAGAEFEKWLQDFMPEMVLIQAGDCGFMLRLAREIAKRYDIPLIIYNSEGYYFKKKDYFNSGRAAKMLYPVFQRYFCKEFEKTIRLAEKSIYCCDKLKKDYDACFALPSEVVYTATEITSEKKKKENNPLKISYLGNLGVGRHTGLVEIGENLQRISTDLRLDVYGKIQSNQVKEALEQCAGIVYRGFVSYEDVVKIIHNSDILVHTESFSDFAKEDLKYAFSTKIADSLASGRCFLVYAPEGMACSEYLKDNKAAYVVERQADLRPVLEKLCCNPGAREAYIDNAIKLVEAQHNGKKNAELFQRILCESMNK